MVDGPGPGPVDRQAVPSHSARRTWNWPSAVGRTTFLGSAGAIALLVVARPRAARYR